MKFCWGGDVGSDTFGACEASMPGSVASPRQVQFLSALPGPRTIGGTRMNHDEAEAAYDYHCYQVDSNDPGPDVDTRREEPMEAPIFRPIPKPAQLTPAERQAKWEAKQRKRRPGFRYVVLNPHVPYEKKG